MPTDRSELLRPSLTRAAPPQAPFSTQAHFLSSFFGGPLAALVMAALNAEKMGRRRADAPWLLLALAAYLALEAALASTSLGQALVQQLQDWVGEGAHGLLVRAYALGCFALFMQRHRREQAACDLMGLPRPAGLWPGIGLIVLGHLLTTLLRTALA